uniref:Uncharacterized protein n=1 Tax=Arundo donax TaxID=35708 RepID=A0A0A9DVA3_ARUDO
MCSKSPPPVSTV